MSTEQLAQAPDFTLEHVLGHSVSLSAYRGRRVVVVFSGRRTAEQVKQGVLAIRRALGPDQVAMLTVLDFRGAPRPTRIVMKGKLKKAYEQVVQEVEAQGVGGEVNMLVDWSGDVVDSYGIDVEQQVVAVAIDEQGRIIGYGWGDQLATQILGILAPNS